MQYPEGSAVPVMPAQANPGIAVSKSNDTMTLIRGVIPNLSLRLLGYR